MRADVGSITLDKNVLNIYVIQTGKFAQHFMPALKNNGVNCNTNNRQECEVGRVEEFFHGNVSGIQDRYL